MEIQHYPQQARGSICIAGTLAHGAKKVKHPKLEKNPKWRNILSKLRNNYENSTLLQKKQHKS